VSSDAAIEANGLRKSYGKVVALDGVDLRAPAGSVLGLLGPNGAGKTTAVRILATLLRADGGSARVAGLDVAADAAALRAKIGLAGQYAAVDENLSGAENLEMVGRLYHLPRGEPRARARPASPGGGVPRVPAAPPPRAPLRCARGRRDRDGLDAARGGSRAAPAGARAAREPRAGRRPRHLRGAAPRGGRRRLPARAAELLERFGLSDAADRLVRTYSGGMRRRLDLAAALVARPPVLFLDEPTTGLDPRSRISLWETIEDRVSRGTTVLLTTQYLDEADRLADRIAVIDRGRLLAEGSSDELKDRFGGERLDLTLEDGDQAEAATAALAPLTTEPPSVLPSGALCFPVAQRQGTIAAAVRRPRCRPRSRRRPAPPLSPAPASPRFPRHRSRYPLSPRQQARRCGA